MPLYEPVSLAILVVLGVLLCAWLAPFASIGGFLRNLVLAAVALCLLLVVFAGVGAWTFRRQVAEMQSTGSGGIGAVSVGTAELVVQTLVAAVVLMAIWRLVRAVRHR
jgi:hypothetical protein